MGVHMVPPRPPVWLEPSVPVASFPPDYSAFTPGRLCNINPKKLCHYVENNMSNMVFP